MINYSQEVEKMCCVAKGPKHGPAPIPEEGKWVKAYDIKDISGFSHGVGWCAPQQGALAAIHLLPRSRIFAGRYCLFVTVLDFSII